MAEYTDDLKSLHIALIDRRQGQEEALQAAEGRELSPLFRDVIALRAKHRELDVLLRRRGQERRGEPRSQEMDLARRCRETFLVHHGTSVAGVSLAM